MTFEETYRQLKEKYPELVMLLKYGDFFEALFDQNPEVVIRVATLDGEDKVISSREEIWEPQYVRVWGTNILLSDLCSCYKG